MAQFYYENSDINQKVLHDAYIRGANKVLSLLSTCVYPDAPYINYPLTEDQLHLGPPHHSNFGYAYAKRMVDVMSRAYRQQYGCNFITAIPNNLYGENDNFDLENSHVIPALIRKVWEAKINKEPSVFCWGDGSPLREFTYSEDIARILLFLMENYDESEPINIGNTDEHSIKEVVEMICDILGYDGELEWQTDQPSGHWKSSTSSICLSLSKGSVSAFSLISFCLSINILEISWQSSSLALERKSLDAYRIWQLEYTDLLCHTHLHLDS